MFTDEERAFVGVYLKNRRLLIQRLGLPLEIELRIWHALDFDDADWRMSFGGRQSAPVLKKLRRIQAFGLNQAPVRDDRYNFTAVFLGMRHYPELVRRSAWHLKATKPMAIQMARVQRRLLILNIEMSLLNDPQVRAALERPWQGDFTCGYSIEM
jgi:hypothetical protein